MRFLSYYSPKAPWKIVYMLQQVEYNSTKFISWATKFPDLSLVQKRGKLQLTKRAQLMLVLVNATVIFGLFITAFLILWLGNLWITLGILIIPFGCVLVLGISNYLVQVILVNPKQNHEINIAKAKLEKFSAQKIAVLGSYGKTTMKELLYTVLSEGKKVAKTPGNKNVIISHARWVNRSLTGDEDVLVFEYGEAGPGDIGKLANFSKPDIAVITGITLAHMDAYPNLDAIATDFANISNVVIPENTYINNQKILTEKIQGKPFDSLGLGEWKVSDVSISIEGTDFTLTSGRESLVLHTGLLGLHNIGPITAVVVVAKKLGLDNNQIIAGVAKTMPFEHRMQPRQLGGAWIIDDSYNGNIEGMRAGLELLKSLPAKRKIYVTPGLVDQGTESEEIHVSLGGLIARAQPNKTVLMENSVTAYIKDGLKQANYKGKVTTETNPLEFYTNIEHFLASGDVLLMQNDWPDNYK